MNDKQVYKLFEPFSILKQNISAFEIKLVRDLGKNEYSAIFISVIEALINNNHLKKIEPFYLKTLTTASSKINQVQTYQLQLKNFFTTTKNVQFQQFLEKQKLMDPYNQISGEFLRSYYLEKHNKAITIPSIIDYFQKYFDLQVLSISQRDLSYFRSKYTSKSIIIYQDQQRYYSLIAQSKEEQLSLSTKQVSLKKQCAQCAQCKKTVDLYFEDLKQHAHCIQCLYNKFYEEKLFPIVCPVAQCIISKYDLDNFIKKNDIDITIYQRRTFQKQCSYCREIQSENDYFQNTCKHIYCRKCCERIGNLSLCMVSDCTIAIDKLSIKKLLESRNDLLSSSQRMVQEVKKPVEYSTNLTIGKSQIDKYKDIQLDQSRCEGCFKQYKIEFLFTNYCGHQYCQICTNKYVERNVTELKCQGKYCIQLINVQELEIFFQKLLEQQYKDKQVICSICKAKQESQKELYKISKCLHLVCFTCINKQYMSTKSSWLAYGRCPEITCKSSINIDDLDQYFTTRQQEKLMELDPQLQQEISTQETSASQKLEQQEPFKDEDTNKIPQVEKKEEKENIEDKMEQSTISKQEKKKINLKHNRIIAMKNKNADEQSKVEESKDLESVEENQILQKQQEITGYCSMCGEDYSQYNAQIKMDCSQDHSIGICCFLSKYKKCMVCEKKTPYESNKFEIFSSKLSGMYSQKLSSYGSSSNYYGQYGQYGSSLGTNLANSNYRAKDDYRPSSNSSAFRNSSQMPVRRY